MNALVTGGAGFIGSNIVSLLLREGWKVRVLDDLSSGYLVNLDHLDVEFVRGSVCDESVVRQACKGIDVVFHLAASVGRQRSLEHPQTDAEVNLVGTINVLEGMRREGVPKIVYSSSAAMFGELQTPVIAEDHPQNADSPYGVSKLAAEKMILAYAGIYRIQGICLRYFNIYGVNQRFDPYGNVIPIFAKRIYSGEPITIFGDGEQTRDFLNVRDVARANLLASALHETSDVFNLGSGASITINDLAARMIAIAGTNTDVLYAPERPADVKHCTANASKAAQGLGFHAETPLSEGLEAYMRWYRNAQ